MSSLFKSSIQIIVILTTLLTTNILLLTLLLNLLPQLLIANSELFSVHHSVTSLVLTGNRDTLSTVLTRDELNHMQDVRNIFQYLPYIAVVCITTLAVNYRNVAEAKQIKLFKATQLTLVVVTMVALISFTTFFEYFHYILFPQGNWSFPADSILIQLYPENFWKISCGVLVGLTLLELELLKRYCIRTEAAIS